MSKPTSPSIPLLPITQVLLFSGLIVTLSMGVRHGFGLWLAPITSAHGWSVESFALALALQNLVWGLSGPFTGMWADRQGAPRVLMVGGLLYAAGLGWMALADTPFSFVLGSGLLIGLAQSCTTYAVVYGVIGRNIPPHRRSWAMGLTAAAGSFGQFLMVPVSNQFIHQLDWQGALWALSLCALLILPFATGLRQPKTSVLGIDPMKPVVIAPPTGPQSTKEALLEALGTPSFLWLSAGYFVCGFQVVFIGVHMPSFLKDQGLSPEVATTSLALIGLFNIFGTYGVGLLGQHWPKNRLLSGIYASRAVAISVFLALPITALSVEIFSAVIGLLWLSTVPPTNALVAQIFGVKHLSMLGGVIFLSHQLGSFLGVWLGGRLHDLSGSYEIVWWISIALGVVAALFNTAVRETPTGKQARP
ncbi:MFS transporter [Leptothrix ochracea]|uniref:MFS transporter n=1 Tax=Leptothrix ochracea TaxID=735331 RepID=UPI0034E296F7